MAKGIFGEDWLAEDNSAPGEITGQPDPQATEPVSAPEEQGDPAPTSAENREAPDLDNGTEKSSPEEGKPELILGKYKSVDALADAYLNLTEKLGIEPEVFDSEEDLAQGYKKAERELGKQRSQKQIGENTQQPQTGSQTQDPNDPEVLRQQVAYQQHQLQQYQNYLRQLAYQQQTQQQGNPNQPTQPAQSANVEKKEDEPVDPQVFLDEFYENPSQALEKIVSPKLQAMQEKYQETLTPIMQEYQQQQRLKYWDNQVQEVQKNLPDFHDPELNELMNQEMQKDPQVVNIAETHPEGMKIALRTLYDRAKTRQLQLHQQKNQIEQRNNQQKQVNQAEKQSAKMNSSTRRVLRQPSPEEAMVDHIFGNQRKKTGAFDIV